VPVTRHITDGRELPDHVAGHRALEFCNTMALWGRPDVHEYLTDHDAAVIWGREHGLLTAGDAQTLRALSAARQRNLLGQLRTLRAGLYYAAVAGASLDTVAPFVAHAVARAQYRREEGVQRLWAPPAPTMLLDRIALDVHRLLEQYGTDAVGLCASEACGWVFLDPSHRRRWCTMAVCGNRAKVRRYHQRRARAG
jgi:predicted RNA-binding Zn ribbon-like protein